MGYYKIPVLTYRGVEYEVRLHPDLSDDYVAATSHRREHFHQRECIYMNPRNFERLKEAMPYNIEV